MEKRRSIIQAATVLFGSVGFDGTNTHEIANEALTTEPLHFFHFHSKLTLFTLSCESAFNEYSASLDKLPHNSSSELRKFIKRIGLQFTIVDEMPEHARLISSTCPAKNNDPKEICMKNNELPRGKPRSIKVCLNLF